MKLHTRTLLAPSTRLFSSTSIHRALNRPHRPHSPTHAQSKPQHESRFQPRTGSNLSPRQTRFGNNNERYGSASGKQLGQNDRYRGDFAPKRYNNNNNNSNNNNNGGYPSSNVNSRNAAPPNQKLNINHFANDKFAKEGYYTRRDLYELQEILESSTESTRDAIRSLLNQLVDIAPDRFVNLVTDQGLKETDIKFVIKNLDLKKEGISIHSSSRKADSKTEDGADKGASTKPQLPIVRIRPIRDMIQAYSEEKAKLKELELISMGSKKALRQMDKKLKTAQKQSSEKSIQFTWGISMNDLKNQKFNELKNRLLGSKGSNKVNLYLIHDQRRADWSVYDIYKKDQLGEQVKLELKRRQLVKKTVEEMLNNEELGWTWTSEGDVETKLVYSITKKPTTGGTNSTSTIKQTDKNRDGTIRDKKKEKLGSAVSASISLQQAEPKPPAKEKKKLTDEDLDALYSFKIDD